MNSERPLVILAYPKVDHEKDYTYHWMPFSLMAIAKVLHDEDIADVVLFDGNQDGLQDWEELLAQHLDRALCIGLSIMTGGGQIGHALEMAKSAKALSDVPLVFGGPHVNVLGHQTAMHPLVDYALQGPGQSSFPEFVRALVGNQKIEHVPGLLSFRDGQLIGGILNPPRAGRLGRYPWNLIDVQSYLRDDPTISTRTLNYVSSQGCVYRCRFCYELTYQRKYTYLDPMPLVDDIEELQKQFGVQGIKFYDADWFVNLKRAVKFCEELKRRKLNINWAASINPNDVLRARRRHPDFLQIIAASGCSRLLMGVESGSDRVLAEIVNKEITRDEIIDVAREIAEHGILGSYTFIVGFPGETPSEEDQTYSLINELRDLDPAPESRVHVFAPYPGTPLYEEALLYGFKAPETLEGWSNYDYYESQTPWTNESTVRRARHHTKMRTHENFRGD